MSPDIYYENGIKFWILNSEIKTGPKNTRNGSRFGMAWNPHQEKLGMKGTHLTPIKSLGRASLTPTSRLHWFQFDFVVFSRVIYCVFYVAYDLFCFVIACCMSGFVSTNHLIPWFPLTWAQLTGLILFDFFSQVQNGAALKLPNIYQKSISVQLCIRPNIYIYIYIYIFFFLHFVRERANNIHFWDTNILERGRAPLVRESKSLLL